MKILAATTVRLIDVLRAQRTLALSTHARKASQALLSRASERVRAGRGSQLEEKRAALSSAQRRLAERRDTKSLETARRRLSAMWGDQATDFSSVEGDLFDIAKPIPLEELVKRLSESPRLARWISEKRLKEAEHRMAEAAGTPDLGAGGGIRRSAG